MDSLTGIHATRKKLIADIRKYVRSQKEDWRRIPWFALQADGRGGYSECYSRCYHHGVWTLHMPNEHGYHGTFIDCATGEVVGSKLESAGDYTVLFLANCLDQLSTAKIIRELQRAASDKIPSWSSQKDFDERAAWRANLIKELGLSRAYVRLESVAA